jgi:hypothetical protein
MECCKYSRQVATHLVHVSKHLDNRLLVKLVQDRDSIYDMVKGVGMCSDDSHDSQFIIEVVHGREEG